MKRHTKIYFKYFGYGMDDQVLCEVCGKKAVDIHHINGRAGKNANDIENLILVCRSCHIDAHQELISKAQLINIHQKMIKAYETKKQTMSGLHSFRD